MKPATGPRHFIISPDNRFVYLLNELIATVTTLSLDPQDRAADRGELGVRAAARHEARARRAARRGRRAGRQPRNTDNDIWAADLHLTPNGRFLYASERTSSTLAAFSVDAATGKLTYLGSTPTEKQPRGFAHRPEGPVPGRVRREVGHDLGLRDRPGERRAPAAAEVPDRQGLELGRDRQLRLRAA